MKKIALTAIIFTASSGLIVSASEALQIGYNFDGQNGNPTQTDANASLSAVTLKINNFTVSTFNGIGNPSTGFAAQIPVESTNSTLEFTVTPNRTLSLTNFFYDVSNSSSLNVEVLSSLDNFGSSLNNYTPTASYTTRSFGLSSFNNISAPVTFRIQQLSSTNPILFDNVGLDFTVTPVPFEFSPTFGIVALGGFWAGRKILQKSVKKSKS